MSTQVQNILFLIVLVALMVPTLIALVKGAPFLPTPFGRVRRMLELADIKKGEKVYDLGCGDGRLVYLAEKDFEADGVGFELSPPVYLWARIRKFLWKSTAKIKFLNFWKQDLSDADVIVCYLLPGVVEEMAVKLDKELKPGARIVSYAFQIKSWQETHKEERVKGSRFAPIWVYEKR